MEDLELHLANECEHVPLTCKTCKIMVLRSGVLSHNCIETLMKLHEVDQSTIKSLEQKIKTMESQMEALKAAEK